jgi:hypothetical protein
MTPEHLHLATNHIPVIGVAVATLPLFWGVLRNSRDLLLCGLILAALCAWATPIVMSTGESAYERYEHGPVSKHLDDNVATYLEAHEQRAHAWSKAMYVTAILATLALGALKWRQELTRWLSMGVVVSCAVSVAAGVWIAESGGKIRRTDFRKPSPLEGSMPNQSVDHYVSPTVDGGYSRGQADHPARVEAAVTTIGGRKS